MHNGYLHAGELEKSVSGGWPELTAEDTVNLSETQNLCQKAEESALEVLRNWRQMTKGNGKDWSSSKEEKRIYSFSFNSRSLLAVATHVWDGSSLLSLWPCISHPQPHPELYQSARQFLLKSS